jgi:hypothetical protein
MTDDRPKFRPVDLTEMQDEGVLMAANEAFFWPLGLALTWDHAEDGTASNLHIREWVFTDGHHETIGLDPEDAIGKERRTRFAAYVAQRDVQP